MKGYHNIAGDGGSRILEQVAEHAHPVDEKILDAARDFFGM
ncbi:MAG: hypothetical protein ACT4QD_01315 [Acidobacteriota bacterium]